jgi:hypothetical protein
MRNFRNALPIVLIFLFGLAMGLSFFNPLYTDEIASRMIHARYFLDHGRTFNLYPQCFPPDTVLPSNAFMVPYNVLESLFYDLFSTPLIVRAVSVISGIILVVLFWRLVKKIMASDIVEPSSPSSLTWAVFGLGVGPFLFGENRPDQTLVFVLIAITFLILKAREANPKTILLHDLLYTATFSFLVLVAFACHPNALFFLPFFLIASFYITRGRLFTLLCSVVLLLCAANSIMFMSMVVSCPLDLNVRQIFQAGTVVPGAILADPVQGIRQIFSNVVSFPSYFLPLAFQGNYLFAWAPSHPQTVFHSLANIICASILFGILFASIGGMCVVIARGVRARKIDVNSQLGLAIFLGVFSLSAVQNSKSWYSTILVVPLLGLIFALLWGTIRTIVKPDSIRAFAIWTQIAALFSLVLFLYTFRSTLTDHAPSESKRDLTLVFSGFNYAEESEKIWKAAAACGFEKGRHYHGIVVDDQTYWALRETEEPIHATYVSRTVWAQSITNLGAFLKVHGSDGLIARCSQILDPSQNLQAIRTGDYCCSNLR